MGQGRTPHQDLLTLRRGAGTHPSFSCHGHGAAKEAAGKLPMGCGEQPSKAGSGSQGSGSPQDLIPGHRRDLCKGGQGPPAGCYDPSGWLCSSHLSPSPLLLGSGWALCNAPSPRWVLYVEQPVAGLAMPQRGDVRIQRQGELRLKHGGCLPRSWEAPCGDARRTVNKRCSARLATRAPCGASMCFRFTAPGNWPLPG